jgi:hypothetical protein
MENAIRTCLKTRHQQRAARLCNDRAFLERCIYQMSGIASEIQKRYRVYCLTTKPADTLMWSHYAENHTGICLEFGCANDVLRNARQVVYREGSAAPAWGRPSLPRDSIFLREGSSPNRQDPASGPFRDLRGLVSAAPQRDWSPGSMGPLPRINREGCQANVLSGCPLGATRAMRPLRNRLLWRCHHGPAPHGFAPCSWLPPNPPDCL